MAEIKTNAMRAIEKLGIAYEKLEYDISDGLLDGIDVAKKTGMSEEEVYKTLVTQSGKNYYVFVIPVARELSLKSAAKSVGEKNVEMIKHSDLLKVTGYIKGGCSPVGMKKQYKTIIDSSVNKLNRIVVSGGKIGYQIAISPANLAKVIEYDIADICA